MIYTVLTFINIVIILIIMSVVSGRKPEMKQLVKLSDEDFVRALLPFARGMRITERGRGYNLASLYSSIFRAFKQIERKAQADVALFEYEKWLYQNIYLVKRFVFSQKRTGFSHLPHTKGEVRIIALARFIVNNSLSSLDNKRVELAMSTIRNEVSLCFEEIMSFDNALCYAIIEQIFVLSQRILFHNKSKALAEKGVFVRDKMTSDIYNYFLLKNPKLSKETEEVLCRMGISPESIVFNYNLSLTETTKMAESLFKALMNHNNFVTKQMYLEFHNADILLKKDKSYQNMSLETRLSYYKIIENISDRANVSEILTANKLLELAQFNHVDIGTILYDHTYSLKRAIKTGKVMPINLGNNKKLEIWYILTLLIVTIASAIGVAFWIGNIIPAIIALLPLFLVVETIFNNFINPFVNNRVLPQMNYQEIPVEHNTMVVVSEFLTCNEQISEAIRHLIELKESNNDKNIQFAILADFKNGDTEVLDADKEMITQFKELASINNCNVFLRKRVLDGKKYVGYERKRGAIMALNKYLMTGNDNEFSYILKKDFIKPTFIMTLDADNTVATSAIRDMVNTIAHPYNEKFDLINAHSRYNLYSIKTKFSKRFLTSAGLSGYPLYSTFYYNLFGKDIFCGKGIFRVKQFYNKLDGVFPSKKILSHDILEGAILSTGCGTTVYEDAPTNFLAERERRKRWQRGDIQLLPFAMPSWKNDEQKIYKSNISPFYRFLMFRNAFAVLKEFVIAVLIVLAILLNPQIWKVIIVLIATPFVINQLNIIGGVKNNIRLRYIAVKSWNNFLSFIEEIFMTPYYAISNATIFVKTVFKMIASGNLLEWKTYYQVQKQKDFSLYIREFLPSLVLLTVLGLVVTLLGIYPIVYLSVAIVLYGLQLSLYLCNEEIKNHNLTTDEKLCLLQYAEKTYKYFQLINTTSGIVGDNIQIKPFKGTSKNTSPTNIGFSLLADICGFYLGYIDKKTTVEGLKNRLQSIDILPKWHGNLYNWYDIDTFEPINNFISSVDSGNLMTTLLIVKEFLKENGEEAASQIADRIIAKTDLNMLYDDKKGLFYIGYNEKANEYTGHYDLLASEARLLSLVYISISGKDEHWRNMQRDYTPLLGNTLLSWSGTMFEYLMPDLFIEPPRFSLLYNSSRNASIIQSRNKHRGIWGVSESGYYDFDDELQYQYYAFGLNILSLRSEFDKTTISPYSAALALKYLPAEAVQNLKRIDELGGFNDYGFYEAIDCSGRIRFVSSYMTHHQGMILVAITNALQENVFARLLNKNPSIAGVRNLLNELPSEYSFGIRQENDKIKELTEKDVYFESISNIEYNTKSAGLTNGIISVCVDTLGNNFVKYKNTYINAYRRIYDSHNGGYFYAIDENKNLFCPSFYPLCVDKNNYNVSYSDIEITLENLAYNIKEDICVADGINAEVRRLTLMGDTKCSQVGYYMDISLNDYDGFNAHPVFNNLFVHTSFDSDNSAIIMQKKAMKKDGDLFVGFVIKGLKKIEVETNRFNLIGRNGNEKNPIFFTNSNKKKLYPSIGDVLEPAVGFKGEFSTEERECQLITVFASSYEELLSQIKILPDDFYSYAKESSRIKKGHGVFLNKLLGNLLYIPYPNKTLLYMSKNKLYREFNHITNHKKALVYIYDELRNQPFLELLSCVRLWKNFGINIRLIIYYSENFKDTQGGHIREQLNKSYIDDYMLVLRTQETPHLFDFAYAVIDTELNFNIIKPYDNILKKVGLVDNIAGDVGFDLDFEGKSTLTSGCGHFCDESYILNKQPLLPYSNVICEKFGGMVITENAGGFFYFDNSRENKACRYDCDPVKDLSFEYLLLKTDEGYYKINGGSQKNHKSIYKKGLLQHFCNGNNMKFVTNNYIIFEGKAKVLEMDVRGLEGQNIDADFLYTFYPCLDWKYDRDYVAIEQYEQIITIINTKNKNKIYFRLMSEHINNINVTNFNNEELPYYEFSITNKNSAKIFIIASKDIVLLNSLTSDEVIRGKIESIHNFNKLGNIKINSPLKSLNYIANNLLYQVFSSRLNGKCGYYQAGGATGFRDQLQDCLAFLHSNSELVKNQILYSAVHQYEEGDVMHWWHHPNFGLRTKITDDKLYLPYAVSQYIEFTQDFSILDIEIDYIKSPLLRDDEHSRLENPPFAGYKESLKKHCLRAIKSALKYGEHKLLLLGGGDWNDGLDHAGIEGKGESVQLSMFCYEVIMDFKQYCDVETSNYLLGVAEDLKNSIDTFCYDEKQYKRLYTDDGKWLGAKSSPQYTVDLVAQSFAVLSGVADKERAENAMNAAAQLVDKRLGIIKLLSPPQTKENYIGYISSYPKGTRENGGQYSHAAIWYIMALLKINRTDEALECFQMINPVEKLRNADMNERYKGEPFVFAGDVYFNKDNEGRVGWSWYTGSAAWAYRLIVEGFYGLKRKGNKLIINPNLPKKLINSELIYQYDKSVYIIEYVASKERKLIIDGVEQMNWEVVLQNQKRCKIVVELVV